MSTFSNKGKSTDELLRRLGMLAAISCGVSSMIGSGIFKKPAVMAVTLGSPELLIAVWVVTGIITLFGIMTIAEIAGMFNEAGGQYVYFNKGYNKFVGYLYGWAAFAVIQTGSIASIAYVFSDSFGHFFPFLRFSESTESIALNIPLIGQITPFKFIGLKFCTIAVIVFLSLVNYFGIKHGGRIQVIFASIKIVVISGIIFCSFFLGNGSVANFTADGLISSSQTPIFLAFIVAMSGAFWAYDGWINVTFIAGEIKDPQKVLPRSMLISILTVISVYVLINLAYLYLIPVDQMSANYQLSQQSGGTYLVATDAIGTIWGAWGGKIIAAAIMLSAFGALNGSIMMSSRIYYAMAKEGLFFNKIATIHSKHHTPANSLLIQALWAALLVFSGTFDQLTDMLIWVGWIFYTLAAFGVFMLRRKMPDAHRPYRVWGYPVIPALFILFSTTFVVFILYSDILAFYEGRTPLINSLMGLIFVLIGIPGYLYWNNKNKKN